MKYALIIVMLLGVYTADAAASKYSRMMDRASVLKERGQYEKAVKILHKALNERPLSKAAKLEIADCYDLMEVHVLAVYWYSQAIAAGPVNEEVITSYQRLASTTLY